MAFIQDTHPSPEIGLISDQQPAVPLWLLNSINNQLCHNALRNAKHVKCYTCENVYILSQQVPQQLFGANPQ